jgi:hypothetical protein
MGDLKQSDWHAVGGMPYGKSFEVADIANSLTPENITAPGEIVRSYALAGKVGPLALVVPVDRGDRQARLFGDAAKVERPFTMFREWHEGRRWLDAMIGAAARLDIPPRPGVTRAEQF